MTHLIKSLFLSGLECPLQWWYRIKQPNWIPEPTQAEQRRMDEGIKIGRLACDLYPGGKRIETENLSFDESIAQTSDLMNNENIPAIFEASFQFESIRIRVDILVRNDDGGWDIVEVKSATSVKEEYYYDVGFQYYVLKSLRIDISKAGLMHLNREYCYNGHEYEWNKLFVLEDLTADVLERADVLRQNVELFNDVTAMEEPPEPNISTHCRACIFLDHCPYHQTEYPTLLLPRINKAKYDELRQQGINDIKDVPDSYPLSDKQRIVRNSVINESEYIAPILADELDSLEYPLYFLDFESFAAALPHFPGTHPYDQIVFQWSCHKMSRDGSLEHFEFLNNDDNDPREAFIKSLITILGEKGSIIHYAPFEKTRLNELADHFPQYKARLTSIVERLWDLLQRLYGNYYHYRMKGSYSIKTVLPILVPDLSYDDLKIRDGDMASMGYIYLLDPEIDPQAKQDIRESLLRYCERDTLAMVEIFRVLKEKTAV